MLDEFQFRRLKLHVYHWYPKQAEEKTVGGNYGLNDQLQALTFINQNKEKINYNRLTIRLEISTKTDIVVKLMLVTDVADQGIGDLRCW